MTVTTQLPRFHRVVLAAATAAAGTLGFLFAYWVWRGVLMIPFELNTSSGIDLNEVQSNVRPWAPWWVLPTLMVPLGMLAWRVLARRGERISFFGAAAAACVMVPAAFWLANLCLQLGAVAQYRPTPPLMQILGTLPAMMASGMSITLIYIMFHGMVMLPAAALLGFMLALVTRAGLRLSAAM